MASLSCARKVYRVQHSLVTAVAKRFEHAHGISDVGRRVVHLPKFGQVQPRTDAKKVGLSRNSDEKPWSSSKRCTSKPLQSEKDTKRQQ